MNTVIKLRGVSSVDGTTKARIERAAVILFAEHGVDGVSTKQIAKAAGISEGAIYRHFDRQGISGPGAHVFHSRPAH